MSHCAIVESANQQVAELQAELSTIKTDFEETISNLKVTREVFNINPLYIVIGNTFCWCFLGTCKYTEVFRCC